MMAKRYKNNTEVVINWNDPLGATAWMQISLSEDTDVLVILILGGLGDRLTVSGLHLAGLPKINKIIIKRARQLTKFCSISCLVTCLRKHINSMSV